MLIVTNNLQPTTDNLLDAIDFVDGTYLWLFKQTQDIGFEFFTDPES